MIEEEGRERELIRQIIHGNRVAMKRFYDDHSGYLTAVCARYIPNKEDVRDILQESFLKIFNAIHKFEYKGSGSLRAWSARIVVNEALNHIKANEKMQFTDLPDGDLPDPDDERKPDFEDIPTSVIMEMIRMLHPDIERFSTFLYSRIKVTKRLLRSCTSRKAVQLPSCTAQGVYYERDRVVSVKKET